MIKANYLVHDCETGGLDENKNPITQYAAIILDAYTLEEIDRWETFVSPYNDLELDKTAIDRTMVSMEDIFNGLPIKEFVKQFTDFADKHRASARNKAAGRLLSVGYNVQFDHKFLKYALNTQKKNLFDYIQDNFIDTFSLSKMAWGETGDEKMQLAICCERAGIYTFDSHGAMADTEVTAELLRYFTDKLRSNSETNKKIAAERKKGNEFFEFSCK